MLKPKPVFETIETTSRGSFVGFVCPNVGAVRKKMAASEWHMLLKLTIGHFHFKLEKKFPQGAKKKYPCIEIIYDFSCQKYSKLRGKNVGIDLNLVL